MTDPQDTISQGRKAAGPTPADRLLERLAEIVGAKAGVQAVFGEPVRHEGLTIIPVARVRWGFGGGGGQTDAADAGPASGSGGGGGVAADAIGYVEIDSAGAAFRPIRERYPSPLFLVASGLSAAILIGALRRLLRGS